MDPFLDQRRDYSCRYRTELSPLEEFLGEHFTGKLCPGLLGEGAHRRCNRPRILTPPLLLRADLCI